MVKIPRSRGRIHSRGFYLICIHTWSFVLSVSSFHFICKCLKFKSHGKSLFTSYTLIKVNNKHWIWARLEACMGLYCIVFIKLESMKLGLHQVCPKCPVGSSQGILHNFNKKITIETKRIKTNSERFGSVWFEPG